MQTDSLPSYVVAIATTNHDSLLDKTAWRRFQVKVDIPKPTRNNLERFFQHFEIEREFPTPQLADRDKRKTDKQWLL